MIKLLNKKVLLKDKQYDEILEIFNLKDIVFETVKDKFVSEDEEIIIKTPENGLDSNSVIKISSYCEEYVNISYNNTKKKDSMQINYSLICKSNENKIVKLDRFDFYSENNEIYSLTAEYSENIKKQNQIESIVVFWTGINNENCIKDISNKEDINEFFKKMQEAKERLKEKQKLSKEMKNIEFIRIPSEKIKTRKNNEVYTR